jgi:hypothetical protein
MNAHSIKKQVQRYDDFFIKQKFFEKIFDRLFQLRIFHPLYKCFMGGNLRILHHLYSFETAFLQIKSLPLSPELIKI